MIAEVKAEKDRIIKFKVTDETVDRDNEILTLTGWDIRQYKKNPVVLWAHDHRDLPIAKSISMKIIKVDGMIVRAQFPDRDTSPFADTVYRMYKGGYLNSVSVGFIPKERVRGENGAPTKITKKEMLEFSAVPIPANPNALQTNGIKEALNDGVINEQEAQECLINAKKYLEDNEDMIFSEAPMDEEIKLADPDKIDPEKEPVNDTANTVPEKPKNAKIDDLEATKGNVSDEAETPITEAPVQPFLNNMPEKSYIDQLLAIPELKPSEKSEDLLSSEDIENFKNAIPERR